MILLLAPLIALAVVGGAALLLRVQHGGQRNLVGSVVETREAAADGCPSILYFTGENCAICHGAQKPALRSLAASLRDGIEIREVDIAVEPALARQYRVMSLPTTIVLDGAGQITDINVGFASSDTLHRQLVDAGMPVAA